MSDDIHKLQDVQSHAPLLPKSISWGQLNSILSQFDHDFYKLSVVQTLRNRIKGDSSESEFKTFLNLFDDDNDFYKTNARYLLKK